MRVGISLLTLVPGVVGGSETYARALTRELAHSGTLQYRVLVSPAAPDAGGGLATEVATEYGRGRLLPTARIALRPAPVRRQLGPVDAVHFPLTVALPRVEVPTAVTLHDLQHLDLPQFFNPLERAYRAAAYHGSARRAGVVIVPSSFVRDSVVERLGIAPERVRVVHHGIDHERYSPAQREREPFLLYPAHRWPHKNHARLLEAFALLRRERPELELVLTGGEPMPTPPGVIDRGRVSSDELVELYRTAAALVFPSLYEGFGAPPLEAMACGCPVAAARAGSLPEVCGDAAVLFDPTSPEAIADGVREALARADELAARGLEHAAGFTWRRSAELHEAAYRELSTRS